MRTCFVIIGYGERQDPISKKIINLDKSYENIIKPVFDKAGYDCNRSTDIKESGVVHQKMFRNILYADIVVADITTHNANVMYELGIRHALKPYSTIILCDSASMTSIPFNLRTSEIIEYNHLGADIGYSEVIRIQKELAGLVNKVEISKQPDSPVHILLDELKVKVENDTSIRQDFLQNFRKSESSLSSRLEQAELQKDNKYYESAKENYLSILRDDPSNEFVIKRIALVTYKSKKPDELTSLKNALQVLDRLNNNSKSDSETTGLIGAIYKRLYQITGKNEHLDHSIQSYRRGYLVNDDYYNGVNYALVNDLKLDITSDENEIKLLKLESNKIRKNVLDLTERKIDFYKGNKDKTEELGWLLLTKAETMLHLGDNSLANEIKNNSDKFNLTQFQLESFLEQNSSKIQ